MSVVVSEKDAKKPTKARVKEGVAVMEEFSFHSSHIAHVFPSDVLARFRLLRGAEGALTGQGQ
jgi:hypothetical protein